MSKDLVPFKTINEDSKLYMIGLIYITKMKRLDLLLLFIARPKSLALES